MTIKRQLLALTGALSLFLILFCFDTGRTAYLRLQDIQIAKATNEFSNDLLLAAGAWAVERGTTNTAIGNPAAIVDTQIKTIADQRRIADEAFARAMSYARSFNDAKLAVLITAADEAAGARLSDLRRRADAVLANRNLGQDAALRTEWFVGISAGIERTQALRQAIEAEVPAVNPEIAAGFTLKQATYLASEFAGRERGFMAGAIAASRPLTPPEFVALGVSRGQIEAGWSTIRARRHLHNAKVQAAVDQVEKLYFQDFQTLRLEVLRAAGDGKYPVNGPDWFARATTGIAQILETQRLVRDEMADFLDQLADKSQHALMMSGGLMVAALLLFILSMVIVMRGVVTPLNRMTDVMQRLTQGDLEVELPRTNAKTEVGAMWRAVEVFRGNAMEIRRLEADERRREQELAEQRDAEKRGLVADFDQSVQRAADIVLSGVSNIHAVATRTAKRSDTLSSRTVEVSASADEISQRLGGLAASVEELTASIGEIARQASTSASSAQEGAADVTSASNEIKRLDSAAAEISQVVSVITEIAAQTNLLALNATIEAARAGDAGKGFAVVASEVKTLANQTARATEDISRRIDAMQAATSAAVVAFDRLGGSIRNIVDVAGSIAAAVEEQRAATGEITGSLSTLNQTMQVVSRNISGMALGSVMSIAGSIEVLWVSSGLEDEAGQLRNSASGFVTRISA